ncbi:unnamed protein product [Darwinula stevensoni]|uniref:Uncharacterized protein n=1 Tax=Darwinula stevensoni TaxID=69355 RepID=A0A7R9AAX9_9CRUS|nr:unnamed protein product [Darwinula stevensoni]CAG0898770.1 unnamed protein product [Darwinula stevensoni]
MTGTFLPARVEDKEMHGVLLFVQDDSQPMKILPIVPRTGDVWIAKEKLPDVDEEQLPPSFIRILFRGKFKVTWGKHTAAILRAFDRVLAELPPLFTDTLGPEQKRKVIKIFDKLQPNQTEVLIRSLDTLGLYQTETLIRSLGTLGSEQRRKLIDSFGNEDNVSPFFIMALLQLRHRFVSPFQT